jgi:predicted Fe-Mo cluster-binding NifX family protein
VLVARIGAGAVGRLSNLGVHAVVAPDYIDSALRRLISSGLLGAPARPGESDFQWLDPL